jgi:6,7-dimethyl-8-ribityllumazine synthase
VAKELKGNLAAAGFRFTIVVARFNEILTAQLTAGAIDTLTRLGADQSAITVVHVPGAFELPQAAKKVALTGNTDAIICLGVVIRGETPHFEYVAGEAASGISRVGTETGIPTIFGVVTTDNMDQAVARCGAKAGNKGRDAAEAAVEMANLFRSIK